jgi:phage pi2 protein 07
MVQFNNLSMYLQELKDYLQSNPQIEKVFMNEDGGWLFYPHPSFKNEVSRNEILKESVETTPHAEKKESAKSKKELKQN